MSILQGFYQGIKAYGPAWSLLFSRKFCVFWIFPVVLLFLFFAGGDWLVSRAGNSLSAVLQAKVAGWVSGISWLSWLTDTTGFVVRLLLKLLYLFLYFTFGGYLVLIFMSPVYSWLSEQIEARLSGRYYPFSIRQMLWEVMRGVLIAVRNLFFQLFLSLIFFLCSFIPVVGLLSPLALFLISAYFYGFSFMDYAIERKRFNVRRSVAYMRRNSGTVTGIGTVFALSLMIPWVSILACCFVSLFSVVAGTVAVHRMEEQERSK